MLQLDLEFAEVRSGLRLFRLIDVEHRFTGCNQKLRVAIIRIGIFLLQIAVDTAITLPRSPRTVAFRRQ